MPPAQDSSGTVPAPASAKGELETILDGVFMDISFTAPAGPGYPETIATERIKVRKISIQKMDALGKAWGKMQQEVACYLDRPITFVEMMTDESFEAAMSEGRRLNFPSFVKWFKWQAQTAEALGNSDLIQNAMSAAVSAAVKSVAEPRPSLKSSNS